jgi:hypothetical protein
MAHEDVEDENDGEGFFPTTSYRSLTVAQAELFRDWGGSLDLSNLTDLTSEVAAIVVEHGVGELNLSGLKHLTLDCATILREHQGHLVLNGLNNISEYLLEILLGHNGEGLSLNGQTTLSDDLAHLIYRTAGPKAEFAWVLSLAGVTKLSRKAKQWLELIEAEQMPYGDREWNEKGWTNVSLPGLEKPAGSRLEIADLRELIRKGGPITVDANLVDWDRAVPVLASSKLNLEVTGLAALSADHAATLSRHRGKLTLDVGDLSPTAAEWLSSHRGGLALDRITTLSPLTAFHLAQSSGPLALNGMVKLDRTTAAMLLAHRGELSLLGLRKYSPEVAAMLSVYPDMLHVRLPRFVSPQRRLRLRYAPLYRRVGCNLDLDGLETLEDAEADELVHHKGVLKLNGLSELSLNAAVAVGSRRGAFRLWLDGLPELPRKVARALVRYEGKISLNGLETLSPKLAAVLIQHYGWALELNGVTTIDDETAAILGSRARPWNLSLQGLTWLSETARGHLRRFGYGASLDLPTTPPKPESTG